jgi:hypothetical protein
MAHFPGLNKPVIVDSETLSPEDAAALSQLVEAARFFALPADLAAMPPRPDARSYALEIRDADREHAVRFSDPIANPQLGALVAFVRRHGRRREG